MQGAAGGHPLPLLSLMSTVACASSSSEMRSRLPPRAAWCSAENLRAQGRAQHLSLQPLLCVGTRSGVAHGYVPPDPAPDTAPMGFPRAKRR